MATGEERKAIELTAGVIVVIAIIAVVLAIVLWGISKANSAFDKGSEKIETIAAMEHSRYDNKEIRGGEISALIEGNKNVEDFAIVVNNDGNTSSYLAEVNSISGPASGEYDAKGEIVENGTPDDPFLITKKSDDAYVNTKARYHSYLMYDGNETLIGYYLDLVTD